MKTQERALRMELLQIQAAQLRQTLRQDFDGLNLSQASKLMEGFAWFETASAALTAALPARWGRWLNLGVSAWRLLRRLIEQAKVFRQRP